MPWELGGENPAGTAALLSGCTREGATLKGAELLREAGIITPELGWFLLALLTLAAVAALDVLCAEEPEQGR